MPTIAEQARATLKRLLELQLDPTPDNYRRIFDSLRGGSAEPAAAPPPGAAEWSQALRRLLDQWERSQAGLSQLQKRQQIEQLAALPSAQALWPALQSLLDRWSALPARNGSRHGAPAADAAPADAGDAAAWRSCC
ncbi:hypothetical protein [Thiomonas sp.]|uniref:hypothetical protein n=1 Tax=Thiomonas sp. TaxID=2047785 RepID=UPI00260A20E6|nr:hypothetical protein [Thiomonas sp.]